MNKHSDYWFFWQIIFLTVSPARIQWIIEPLLHVKPWARLGTPKIPRTGSLPRGIHHLAYVINMQTIKVGAFQSGKTGSYPVSTNWKCQRGKIRFKKWYHVGCFPFDPQSTVLHSPSAAHPRSFTCINYITGFLCLFSLYWVWPIGDTGRQLEGERNEKPGITNNKLALAVYIYKD